MQAVTSTPKTKPFLPIQALISRVLKKRKFKCNGGWCEFKRTGSIIVPANDHENAAKYSVIKKMVDPYKPMPQVRPRNTAYHCQI